MNYSEMLSFLTKAGMIKGLVYHNQENRSRTWKRRAPGRRWSISKTMRGVIWAAGYEVMWPTVPGTPTDSLSLPT